MYIGIIMGILAGFIASKLFDGKGKGCLVNCVLGLIGGALGGWLADALGIIPVSWFGELIISVIGAMIFLWIWNKLIK